MPYYPVPALSLPSDDQPVWRYMDLAKFLHLLRSRALFFTRADKLGDEFEGSLTLPTEIYWLQTHENHNGGLWIYGRAGLEGPCPPELREAAKRAPFLRELGKPSPKKLEEPVLVKMPEHLADQHRSDLASERMGQFVTCWHANDYESMAMWKTYAPGGAGIAIQSDIARLKASLGAHKGREITVAEVQYRDYASEAIEGSNITILPLLTKRKSYTADQEVRAIITDPNMKASPGVTVPVNLDTLIDRVVVAPQAPGWYKELVRGVVTDYKLEDKVVETSSLDERPLW